MERSNLNRLGIPNDSGSISAVDNSTRSSDGTVAVYFRNIDDHLIEHISEAQMVVGCVAWLTNEAVLRVLAKVPDGVSIVVQKEDFLRPDLDAGDGWKDQLRQMYEALKRLPERHQIPGLVGSLSVCSDPTIQPVRCVGNYNRDKKPAFPRMHNKFLVFCKTVSTKDQFGSRLQVLPYAVWTGSFNLTKNAGSSLENAVVIKDLTIVKAYYSEWEQILALSEPLDWETDWSEPEWRIGT